MPATAEKPAQKSSSSVDRHKQKTGFSGINRRKYPRIKVNYIALVLHAQRGEEFLQCEDVSRGGLRFKSTSRYLEQTLIEVAAPSVQGRLRSSYRRESFLCRNFRSKTCSAMACNISAATSRVALSS